MPKTILTILGVVFLLAGVAGFIEPLSPDGNVFGLFFVGEPGTVHNVVHLLSGVLALAAASRIDYARLYGQVFGVVYALVTVLGFFTESGEEVLGILPINGWDNLLHLVITLLLLYVGFGRHDDGSAQARGRA